MKDISFIRTKIIHRKVLVRNERVIAISHLTKKLNKWGELGNEEKAN